MLIGSTPKDGPATYFQHRAFEEMDDLSQAIIYRKRALAYSLPQYIGRRIRAILPSINSTDFGI